jgi:glycosyltransferase involved in cell wall biosynthesis
MKPLRVLFITTGLATGGAEMALIRLIRHLPGDISAQVVSLTDAGTLGPRLTEMGIPLFTLGMRRGRLSLSALFHLFRLIRRLRPDVVQTWMYHADLVGGLAARLCGVRRLVWGIRHSNLDADKNKGSTLAVVRSCARLSRWLPAAIVSCSEAARRIHIGLGYRAELFTVLPNGIELDRFRPDAMARDALREELEVPRETPLVGLIARFDVQKNHEGFFQAASLVHRTRPEVHFVLAGRGVDDANASLRAWREDAGVTSATHLLGERADIPRLMAAFDVLASPSWGEAFPNVLAEAMACGVPCAATDAGDSAMIVGDTGRIVPVGDMPALAAAILALLEEPVETHSLRAERVRGRVLEHFGIEAVATAYADFYRGLA